MFFPSLFKRILSSLLLLCVVITSKRCLQVGLLPQALAIDGKPKIHRKANSVVDLCVKDELQVKYSVLQLFLRQAVCGSQLPLQSDYHAVRICCKDVYLVVSGKRSSLQWCLTQWMASRVLYGLSSCSCEETVFAVLLLLHRDSASEIPQSGVFTTLFTSGKYYILRMYFALLGWRGSCRMKHCFSNPGRMAQGSFVLWSHHDVGACWGFAAEQNL